MKHILVFIFLIFAILNSVFSQCKNVISLNDSQACNIDLECSNQYNIPSFFETHVARSVVKLQLCTSPECVLECFGTLIVQRGVNANDLKGYIITARHCITRDEIWNTPYGGTLLTEEELANSYVIFNFQKNCGQTPNVGNSSNYYRYQLKGLRLIDYSQIPDFALLEIIPPIPPHFNVYYSGWNNVYPFNIPPLSPLAVCDVTTLKPFTAIHHPKGDLKKISQTDDLKPNLIMGLWVVNLIGTLLSQWLNVYLPNVCNPQLTYIATNYYLVNGWDLGITEKGSSGSGLWDKNFKLIGMLSYAPYNYIKSIF